MSRTVVDPEFVLFPLFALAFASLAAGLWQWYNAKRNWTLVVPAVSLIAALFSLGAFVHALQSAPTETYVRISDVQLFEESRILGEIERALASQPMAQLSRQLNVTQSYPSYSRSVPSETIERALASQPMAQLSRQLNVMQSYPSYPRSVPSETVAKAPSSQFTPMLTDVVNTGKYDPSARIWLVVVLTFASALVATTLIQVAPGQFFDTLRRGLHLEQAFTSIGAVPRGFEYRGPRTVPPHLEEMTAVRESPASKQTKQQKRDSSATLRELEVESVSREGQLRPLTEDELAEMKRPLYDRFVAS
jgi:hypothetical protein